MLKRVQHDGVWSWLAVLCLLILAFPVSAQTFPPLTGRVVDAANMFTPEERAGLDARLKAVAQATGRPFVIATIADVQGYPLEDYGYRLGRAWGIGEKDKNNGVVMFVVPNNPVGQRGPRIEVGYGLEPILTDAFTSSVAKSVMSPMLRAGDTIGAFNRGIDLVAEQMKLSPEEAAKRTADLAKQDKKRAQSINPSVFIFWIVIFLFFILPLIRRMAGGRRYRGGGSGIGDIILWSALNSLANSGRSSDSGSGWGGGGGGWGGGGSDGGGFSGGGGSFGGGGASGDW